MKRWLTLFACLAVVLSFGMGSIAHAMEPVVCLDATTAAETGHVDGDGDQVPGDGDKGYPHHHGGCQGHQVVAPFEKNAGASQDRAASAQHPARSIAMATAGADPALRPPQA